MLIGFNGLPDGEGTAESTTEIRPRQRDELRARPLEQTPRGVGDPKLPKHVAGVVIRQPPFLTSPKELFAAVRKNGPQTKVTLELDDDALAFFKREANRRKTSYQRMIRNLIRSYARARSAR